MYELVTTLLILLAFLAVYSLPTILAIRANHKHKLYIMFVNIIGGVVGIGWLVAFLWLFIESKPSKTEESDK